MSIEVHINPSLCTGAQVCVHWHPDVFAINQDGVSQVLQPSSLSQEQMLEVANTCPNGAIVVTKDGVVLAGDDGDYS